MSLPKRIMPQLCWSFIGTTFSDRATFEAEFGQDQMDIRSEAWDPRTVAFNGPQIEVRYAYWDDEGEVEEVLSLAAADGKAFSEGELMYMLHNAVVGNLNDMDHHFFEGLSLGTEPGQGAPLYDMHCGS